MKNLLLLATCLCSVFFANAQFTTGQKLISGQFGFDFSNTSIASTPGVSSKTSYFRFSPAFSRFKSPNLMTGFGIFYSYNRYHSFIGNPSSESLLQQHSFGLFVNRTKLESLAKRFYFTYTGTVSAEYQTSRPDPRAFATVIWQEGYGVSASGSIGLLYELNPRFLLSWELNNLVRVGYSHNTESGKTLTTTSYKNVTDYFSLSTNLAGFNLGNVGVGLRYVLKK